MARRLRPRTVGIDGAPLSEVVADLSRYRVTVTLKSGAAGESRVTAGLRVEQISPARSGPKYPVR